VCVADFTPGAGPVQRAWVVLHNLDTVVDQARENYAVCGPEDEGDFAHILVGLEQAQAKALTTYAELRRAHELPVSIEAQFRADHEKRAVANQVNHD
jgi:hypothetical protein